MRLGPSRHFQLPTLTGGLALSAAAHGIAVAAVVWLMSGRPPAALEIADRPAASLAGLVRQNPPPPLEPMRKPLPEREPIDWSLEEPLEEPLLSEALVTAERLPPPPLPVPDPHKLDMTPAEQAPDTEPVTTPSQETPGEEPAVEETPEPPGEPAAETPAPQPSNASDRDIEIRTEVNPKPEYPARAIRRGIEGVVVLRVEVLTDGTAGRIVVHESSGYAILDRAALACVANWRFHPAQRGGELVVEELDVPVRFRLSDSR